MLTPLAEMGGPIQTTKIKSAWHLSYASIHVVLGDRGLHKWNQRKTDVLYTMTDDPTCTISGVPAFKKLRFSGGTADAPLFSSVL